MDFKKALEKSMTEANINVEELSKKLTITKSYIYKLLSGKEYPSERLVKRIDKMFPLSKEFDPDYDLLCRNPPNNWFKLSMKNSKLFREDIRNAIVAEKARKPQKQPYLLMNLFGDN